MAASTGLAITGTEVRRRGGGSAAAALSPYGSNGVEHVVVLMMENRSFDHFLSWLPDADGRHDMNYPATDGNYYPNYPLAPDFQGCGYWDPDHSWEGFLVEHNFGRMDGFLQRPTAPANNPGVTLARRNTFPIGYYTNRKHQTAAARRCPTCRSSARSRSTTRCSTITSARSPERPSRIASTSTRPDGPRSQQLDAVGLPSIWDQLSPIPNTKGVPTGGYFFRDLPFLALWGTKYFPFWHMFAGSDADVLGIPIQTLSFIDTVAGATAQRQLHRPGVRHGGQRDIGRRPSAGRHPAR